jgi:hypothetical protein
MAAAGMVDADRRVAQFARVIPTEIERCAKIIGELLDFSRERPLYRVPVPVPELVKAALEVCVKPPKASASSSTCPRICRCRISMPTSSARFRQRHAECARGGGISCAAW